MFPAKSVQQILFPLNWCASCSNTSFSQSPLSPESFALCPGTHSSIRICLECHCKAVGKMKKGTKILSLRALHASIIYWEKASTSRQMITVYSGEV
ncbi:growth arrest-specific 2-like [Moniliophthora roreri]|nr:growth arrest-specific 2-like [Moniliophthora roreri]